MSVEKPNELAQITNCSHCELMIDIPDPEKRNGSSFTFNCPFRERGGSRFQKLFPEKDNAGDVILAVVRDYQSPETEATLICTADSNTCTNVMPGSLAEFEKKAVRRPKKSREYYLSNSLIATHREFKEAELQK